jgi:Muconolactone delta-isomerase
MSSNKMALKEDRMKIGIAFALAVSIVCVASVSLGHAQSADVPTPTTRILAIGTVNPGVDPAAVRAILPTEVRETVKLYLDGKIDQWYSLQGRPGVAFILNVTDQAAAHEMLERLPLGRAHLMNFDLIPLAPLNPLRQLQGMAASPP